MPCIARFGCYPLVLAVGVLVLLTGCSSLPIQETEISQSVAPSAAGDNGLTPPANSFAAGPAPQFTLEIREAGKDPQIKRMPLQGNLVIDDVLKTSGATKRFPRMNLELTRTTGKERHKLEVRYDRAAKRVTSQYDYALHPGDHLVVIEDTRTVLDDMMDGVSSRMGLNNSKQR